MLTIELHRVEYGIACVVQFREMILTENRVVATKYID